MPSGLSDASPRYVPLDEQDASQAVVQPPKREELVRPKGYMDFVARNKAAAPAPAPPSLTEKFVGGAKDLASTVGDGLSSAAGWAKSQLQPEHMDLSNAAAQTYPPMGNNADVGQGPQGFERVGMAPLNAAKPENGAPAPVDAGRFKAIKAELGAMPRAERLKVGEDLKGWQAEAVKVANAQLDQEQQGMESLGMNAVSPTLEGRAAHYTSQGADGPTAMALAKRDMGMGAAGDVLRSAEPPTAKGNEAGNLATDTAVSLAKGVNSVGTTTLRLADILTPGNSGDEDTMKAATLGKALDFFQDRDRELDGLLSTKAKEAQQAVSQANGFFSAAGKALSTRSGFLMAAESLPSSIAAGGFAIKASERIMATKLAQAGVQRISQNAASNVLARGGSAEAAKIAAERATAIAHTATASAMMAAADFAMDGTQAYDDVMSEVSHMRESSFDNSPMYKELRASGLDHATAARTVAKEAAARAFLYGGAMSALVSPLGAGVEMRAAGKALGMANVKAAGSGSTARTFLASLVNPESLPAVVAIESLQEGLQSGGPQAGQNLAVRQTADSTKSLSDGVAAAAGAGAATGGIMGGGMHMVAGGDHAAPAAVPDAGRVPGQRAEPVLAPAKHDDGPISADEVLGAVQPKPATPVDAAAHEAATSPTNDRPEPTQAQKEAGNYKLGHTRIAGLDIKIENPEGSTRKGVGEDGKPWETTMQAHYGYIAGTEAKDGDKLDVFVKPGTPEDWHGAAYVVDQVDPKTGQLDEHKVIFGAADQAEAEQIYRSNYSSDWQGMGAITRLPMPAFKAWAKSGRLDEPLGDISARTQQSVKATPEQAATTQPEAPAVEVAAPDVGASSDATPAAGARAADPARPKARPPQLDPEHDTMLQALAKLGGIRRDTVASEFGLKPEELQHAVSTGKLKGYPFRKTGGMDMDQALTAMSEAGYFDGVPEDQHRAVFEQAIHDELGGRPRLTTHGRMREAAQAFSDNQEQARASAEADAQGQAELDAERAAIMAEAGLSDEGLSALTDDDIRYAESAGTTDAEHAKSMRAMGFTEEEIADELKQRQGPQGRDQEGNGAAAREAQAPDGTGSAAPRDERARGDGRAAPADAGRIQEGTKRPGEKVKPGERLKRVSDYFTPGNIVKGYGGHSRVISFDWVKGSPGRFNVKVQSVVKDGEGWKVDPTDARERVHSTQPTDRELKAGPVGQWSEPALTSHTESDLQAKAEREADGVKAEAKAKATDAAKVRQADEAKDNKARADATVEDFELGKSADEQMSGMGDMFADKPGKANTIFTEDAAAAARALLRKKLGTLNSGIDPEILQAGITLAGYHIERGARTFTAYAKAMVDDLGEAIKPYLKSWYMGVKYDPRASGFDGMSSAADVEGADIHAITDNAPQETKADVSDTSADLEPDRKDTTSAKRVLAQPDGNEPAGSDQRAGKAGKRAGSQGSRRGDDAGVPAGGAATARERGDQPVSGGSTVERPALVPAGSDVDQRGGGFGDRGIPVETVSAGSTRATAKDGLAQGVANRAQRQAPKGFKAADLDNIRETLPLLQGKQQEDVHRAEVRFAEPDGYGILFTNGTGTGKTYTGMGVVKRLAMQGKDDVLMVAPSDKIIEDWITTGKRFGLDITKLASTSDSGKGLVITTYANFGDNKTLADRSWDGVVLDEAHYLMQAEDGKPTQALNALRAITMHPDGAHTLHAMRNRADLAQHDQLLSDMRAASKVIDSGASKDEKATAQAALDELKPKYEALHAKLEEARKAIKVEVGNAQGADRTRVTFLSATPWAYVPTVDWANGYLFDYSEGQPADETSRGYNDGSNRERFFMQHFGYRMRYNKLTRPDAKVNVGLMERQFNAWLRKSGALSARTLDVAADYDRRFVLVESAIGARIDQALNWISERARGNREENIPADEGARALANVLDKRFDYLSRRYLLEAIKAEESIKYVRQNLAMGRKVVVFHDYKKGGGFNPFDQPELPAGGDDLVAAERVEKYNAALRDFKAEFKDLLAHPFATMASPIQAYQKAFPNVLLFNGDVSPKDRRAAVAKFQTDDSEHNLILVQSAAGKEGISLHDTTGKHQRVLYNLGQPTQPTTAIQQEGRTYRTGQVTNAIFRYFNTGTNWEKWAFATTIAQRASTAENLGMGEQARALKDAFISAFEEADAYPPGHEGEGTGGKARDQAANEALTEFDRAVSFYYGTQKKSARTKAAEGKDYFATPEPLGLKMVEWMNPHGGDHVLEPSAGHGAIARWLPENTERTAVEPSTTLRPRLAMVFDGKIVASNFEDLHIANKFDGIVMNPPFGVGGKVAIEHLDKAANHLRDGGRVVALIPTGPAADKRFDKWFHDEETRASRPLYTDERLGPIHEGDVLTGSKSINGLKMIVGHVDKHPDGRRTVRPKGELVKSGVWLNFIESVQPGPRSETYRPAEGLHMVADIKLPQVAFERAGTSVASHVVVLEKLASGTEPPVTRHIDLSDAKDIQELFERIRDLSLPPRLKPETQEGSADADPVATTLKSAVKPSKTQIAEFGQALAEKHGMTIAEHTTGKGKVLKGVVKSDITQAQAKAADAYTFKKDGGWFIRAEHVPAMLGEEMPAFSLPPSANGRAVGKDGKVLTIGKLKADQFVSRIASNWKGLTRTNIVVVDSFAGLPLEIIHHGLRSGGVKTLQEIQGVAHNGKVYLVANTIADENELQTALFHEAFGHLGVNAVMGARTVGTLSSLMDSMGGLKAIEVMARKIRTSDTETVWDRLQPYIRNLGDQVDSKMGRAVIADEFLAFAAQVNDQSVLAKFKGYLSDAKAGMARFARAAGLKGLAARLERMTDGDVAAFVRDARRAIVTGQAPRSGRYVIARADGDSMPSAHSLRAAVATSPADGATLKPSSGILDTILRKAGGTVVARLTSPGYTRLISMMDRALESYGGKAYDYAKSGLVSDRGLSEPYIEARADMRTAIRRGARETKTIIDNLQSLDRAQSRIAYLWMSEKPDTEQERALLAELPEDSRTVLLQLKDRIEQLSREAVDLGLISQDTYERNSMAYLHRSYKRYEVSDDKAKVVRTRAIKILGDQFKGRGMRDDVPMSRIQQSDWWARKEARGKADDSLKGEKFIRLERREMPDTSTAELFEEGKPRPLGRLLEVAYWPASEALPSKYADWRQDGTWEARFFNKPGKVGMWRDFTLAERTAMGEIQEVRYSTAKTMLQMTRDVETARLLDWVARRESRLLEDQIPDGHTVVPAKESMLRSYLPDEWVQVPDAGIPGTGGLKRFGNLAGRFVPGPVWNDLRQLSGMTDRGDVAKMYDQVMKVWKISKTALSPTTHVNNVMSNFIFADAHDVQASHILAALKAWASHKKDKQAADLIADYQDNGGDGGKFNDAELREDVMGEMIAELEREVGKGSPTAAVTAAQVVDLVRHKEFRQAFAAIGQTKTAGVLKKPAQQLIKLYGHEDELFRLAAFIKAKEDGLTSRAAGKFAHESFLNYDINAPWVQAARRSFFPFVSFTYRAVPMLLRTFADKPWKLAKYAAVAGALNALAYGMLGGGGDEDKERALLPDEKAGKIWGIFPKLMRMPWNDSHDSPVFLDVRRWIPAGDVVDMGQQHTALPVPSPLMPGGPLVILAELVMNRSTFTGKDITKETDTLAEKYGKVGDYLWKAAAPNFPGIPGTYATDSIMGAGSGKTDPFGREQSLGQATLSSVGVKLGSYPIDVLTQNAARDANAKVAELRRAIKADGRQLGRKGISREEFDERTDRNRDKISKINRGLSEKLKQGEQ
jgi:hypothetical protein